MVKKEKLYQRLVNSQTNVNFNDFETVILAFGFVLRRTSGSHQVYRHPDVPDVLSIQPKKDGTAKPYQVRQFLKYVKLYDLRMTS